MADIEQSQEGRWTTEVIDECLDHGLKIVCDSCDHVGSNSWGYPMWQLQPDGRVLCQYCAENGERE